MRKFTEKYKRWRAFKKLQRVTENHIVETILKMPGIPLSTKINRGMIRREFRKLIREHTSDDHRRLQKVIEDLRT
jgi:hypothetical protein